MEDDLMNDELKVLILTKIGETIKNKAIKMAPVDQGHLRSLIDYKISEDKNSVTVSCDLPYADDLEYGTPPEPLSSSEKESVRGWAQRHGARARGVIWHIETKGIKIGSTQTVEPRDNQEITAAVQSPFHVTSYNRDSYRPFMRPALFQTLPHLNLIITKAFLEWEAK
jgi:hypothetical protein